MDTVEIRRARDEDVTAVKDLFITSYGHTYPYKEFYDDYWLKKTVYNDNYLFLVAEMEDRIVGTASLRFDAGDYTDLVGEFGRLVVDPDVRGHGIGTLLMDHRLAFAHQRLHLGYVEARTIHPFAQRIAIAHEFKPVGFLPLEDLFDRRESSAMLMRLFGPAHTLRRNHPHIIPEVFTLAATSLRNLELPNDLLVIEDAVSYPMQEHFEVDELSESGIPHVLRIERGRLKRRQVFGNMLLSYGMFSLQPEAVQYLVAKDGDSIVGAIGYTYDTVGKTVRILELIDLNDAVGGFLLSELDRHMRQEGVAYAELYVSAYWPRIQRTLDQLGFSPVAYCPSYVIHGGERLDAIRMAKVYVPFDLGDIQLVPEMDEVHDIVVRGFVEKRIGINLDDIAGDIALFDGLTGTQLRRLASICSVREYAAGDVIFTQGDVDRTLYIVVSGCIDVRVGLDGRRVGQVVAGDVLGEISLVERRPHSATAVATRDGQLIVFTHRDFDALTMRYPHIGLVLMRNVACSLGNKLKTMDELMGSLGRAWAGSERVIQKL